MLKLGEQLEEMRTVERLNFPISRQFLLDGTTAFENRIGRKIYYGHDHFSFR
jgi:hypothetical protein